MLTEPLKYHNCTTENKPRNKSSFYQNCFLLCISRNFGRHFFLAIPRIFLAIAKTISVFLGHRECFYHCVLGPHQPPLQKVVLTTITEKTMNTFMRSLGVGSGGLFINFVLFQAEETTKIYYKINIEGRKLAL